MLVLRARFGKMMRSILMRDWNRSSIRAAGFGCRFMRRVTRDDLGEQRCSANRDCAACELVLLYRWLVSERRRG